MSEVVSHRQLSVEDAPQIVAAISRLVKIGLKPLVPEREFPEAGRRKAEELEGLWIPDPPLRLTWAHLALTGSEQVFANAIWHSDHCFDGAGEEDYAQVVASIMALAGEDWPGDGTTVAATSVVREGPYGPSDRMEIRIHQHEGCAPFDLIADKDFDWSVVPRLNERLPSGATGRFAAFFDGNATIVYLRPDQLTELSKLFGYDFVSEIAPLPKLPSRMGGPSHLDAAARNRLSVWTLVIDFWKLVIGLLIGVNAASRLVAMTLRGTPYTITAFDFTPISLADAPLEFAFYVTVHVIGALFLVAAPYVIVTRWRDLRQGRRDS